MSRHPCGCAHRTRGCLVDFRYARTHKRVIALPWTGRTGADREKEKEKEIDRSREGGQRERKRDWGRRLRYRGLRRVAEAHGGLMHQHQSGLPVQLLHSTHWPPSLVRWCTRRTCTRITEIKHTNVCARSRFHCNGTGSGDRARTRLGEKAPYITFFRV